MAYQYSPLQGHDSIRLLVLHAGTVNDILRGDLQDVVLAASGHYEALSYVWGSEQKCCTLHTSEGTIGLTESLYDALLDLRLPDRERRLWADAICINQDDNEEKCAQVDLMGVIYGSAALVQVHLGRGTEQSNTAFQLLEEMASPVWYDKGKAGKELRASFAKKNLGPVAAMMNRPWWQRMWIIQEFVNAKDVYMIAGSKRLHWGIFFQAVDRTDSYDELSLAKYRKEYPNASTGVIAFATLDIGRDKTTTSLLELLDLFQNARATRQRDHLFALLPLASDAADPRFRPDYAEPLDSIVRRYAAAFVDQGQVFHLLGTACPNLKDVEEPRFPTWIPDWTRRRLFRDPDGVSTYTTVYEAAAATKPDTHYDRQKDTLFIKGQVIDRLHTIIQGPSLGVIISTESSDGVGTIAVYVQKCLKAMQARRPGLGRDDLYDIIWRTLTVDRNRYGEKLDEEGRLEMKASFEDLASILDPSPTADRVLDEEAKLTDIATGETNVFCFVAEALTDYLSFALTDDGIACLVPSASKIGDYAVVLHGCSVPFVLRPVKSATNSKVFQFVRKAYLHGFMDGEAILDQRFATTSLSLR